MITIFKSIKNFFYSTTDEKEKNVVDPIKDIEKNYDEIIKKIHDKMVKDFKDLDEGKLMISKWRESGLFFSDFTLNGVIYSIYNERELFPRETNLLIDSEICKEWYNEFEDKIDRGLKLYTKKLDYLKLKKKADKILNK